jgi:hypothetical protein
VNRSLERPSVCSLIISIVALLCFVAPLIAEAQSQNKVWRVGILATANPRTFGEAGPVIVPATSCTDALSARMRREVIVAVPETEARPPPSTA